LCPGPRLLQLRMRELNSAQLPATQRRRSPAHAGSGAQARRRTSPAHAGGAGRARKGQWWVVGVGDGCFGTTACSGRGGRHGGRCSTFLAAVDAPRPLRDPTPRPERGEAREGTHGRSSTRRRRADTSRGGSGDGCRRGRGGAPATTRFSARQGLGWGNEVAWELQRSGSEALVREVGDGDGWKGNSASASMASGGGGHEVKGRAQLGEGTGAPESFDTHTSFRSTLDRQCGVPRQEMWYICMSSAL
jgi:hypothetical protein